MINYHHTLYILHGTQFVSELEKRCISSIKINNSTSTVCYVYSYTTDRYLVGRIVCDTRSMSGSNAEKFYAGLSTNVEKLFFISDLEPSTKELFTKLQCMF